MARDLTFSRLFDGDDELGGHLLAAAEDVPYPLLRDFAPKYLSEAARQPSLTICDLNRTLEMILHA